MTRFFQKLRKPAAVGFWFWLVAIMIVSAWPNLPNPEQPETNLLRPDYLFHFGTHLVLALLFFTWKSSPDFYTRIHRPVLSFTGLLLFAACTELIQLYIPGRSFNLYDMAANSLGTVLGSLSVLSFRVWLLYRKATEPRDDLLH